MNVEKIGFDHGNIEAKYKRSEVALFLAQILDELDGSPNAAGKPESSVLAKIAKQKPNLAFLLAAAAIWVLKAQLQHHNADSLESKRFAHEKEMQLSQQLHELRLKAIDMEAKSGISTAELDRIKSTLDEMKSRTFESTDALADAVHRFNELVQHVHNAEAAANYQVTIAGPGLDVQGEIIIDR